MIKYRTFKGVMKMEKSKKKHKNMVNKIQAISKNPFLKKGTTFPEKTLYQNLFQQDETTVHEQEAIITDKEEPTIQIDHEKTIKKESKKEDNWRKLKKETTLEQLNRYREFLIYLQKKKESELEAIPCPIENTNGQTSDKKLIHKK